MWCGIFHELSYQRSVSSIFFLLVNDLLLNSLWDDHVWTIRKKLILTFSNISKINKKNQNEQKTFLLLLLLKIERQDRDWRCTRTDGFSHKQKKGLKCFEVFTPEKKSVPSSRIPLSDLSMQFKFQTVDQFNLRSINNIFVLCKHRRFENKRFVNIVLENRKVF